MTINELDICIIITTASSIQSVYGIFEMALGGMMQRHAFSTFDMRTSSASKSIALPDKEKWNMGPITSH